ncbi:MAG: DUF934 domain-containing protein [Methylococcaceae bacterium]|nr:DUF934 domain-containing protein [Methylococcaceae bacterium]
MQIIKDKEIINNSWSYIADDDALKTGDISVSVSRWKKDKDILIKHQGKIGIRLRPEDTTGDIADDLGNLQLIELDFPSLADGRLFSHAWLLRGRYHYAGEIRATGHYLPDQVFYLSRVGVNAFSPEKPEDLPVVLASLNDFSVTYQCSIN